MVVGKLVNGFRSLYSNRKADVKVRGKKSDRFEIKRGLRRGYRMSPWLLNIFIDVVLRETRIMFGRRGYKWRKMIWYGCWRV